MHVVDIRYISELRHASLYDVHWLLIVISIHCSHPLAEQQIEAVENVLTELDAKSIPKIMVWNKVVEVTFCNFSLFFFFFFPCKKLV